MCECGGSFKVYPDLVAFVCSACKEQFVLKKWEDQVSAQMPYRTLASRGLSKLDFFYEGKCLFCGVRYVYPIRFGRKRRGSCCFPCSPVLVRSLDSLELEKDWKYRRYSFGPKPKRTSHKRLEASNIQTDVSPEEERMILRWVAEKEAAAAKAAENREVKP